MVQFTASGLSDGNKLIPGKLIIDENSVTIKSPRLFGRKKISFPIGQIIVSIKRPANGFCEVEFLVNGKSFSIPGFTVHEAKMIKSMIQEKNTSVVISGSEDYRSEVQKRFPNTGEDMMQFGQLLRLVDQQREKHLSVIKVKNSRAILNDSLKKEMAYLIRSYKEADFEIVDDEEEIDKNRKITGIFITDCLTKAGRGRISYALDRIQDEEEDNEYTNELELLLILIDNIYSSLVYNELNSENKPRFPFGLDQKKVRDKLADPSVSNSAKMTRITGRVDNFITRICNTLKSNDL
jgi:hypothetical protein